MFILDRRRHLVANSDVENWKPVSQKWSSCLKQFRCDCVDMKDPSRLSSMSRRTFPSVSRYAKKIVPPWNWKFQKTFLLVVLQQSHRKPTEHYRKEVMTTVYRDFQNKTPLAFSLSSHCNNRTFNVAVTENHHSLKMLSGRLRGPASPASPICLTSPQRMRGSLCPGRSCLHSRPQRREAKDYGSHRGNATSGWQRLGCGGERGQKIVPVSVFELQTKQCASHSTDCVHHTGWVCFTLLSLMEFYP